LVGKNRDIAVILTCCSLWSTEENQKKPQSPSPIPSSRS